MKKLTSLVLAGIFTIFCLTGCSDAEGSTVISEATTTVTTVTTTTTVPESVPESTTTTKETVTSSTTDTEITTESTTTTSDASKTDTTTTTTQPEKKTTSTTKATTKATTKETTKTTTKTPEPTGNRVVLNVKNIQMLPELPSGSEITSLAMVLNYFGMNISKMDLINYLTIDEVPNPKTGTWSDPFDAFVGHPTKNGYGCYLSVLEDCANNYFNSNNINNYEATTRVSRDETIINEIKNGNPVIIKITKDLKEPIPGYTWVLENHDEITWYTNECCMVIIGYDLDKKTFIISNPCDSNTNLEYPINAIMGNFGKLIGPPTLTIRKMS